MVLNYLQFFSFLFSVAGQELYELTCSYSYTLHWILCGHSVDTSLGLQQLFQSAKQCSTSGQNNTTFCNICSQLSSEETVTVFGRPVTRLRPRTSRVFGSVPG